MCASPLSTVTQLDLNVTQPWEGLPERTVYVTPLSCSNLSASAFQLSGPPNRLQPTVGRGKQQASVGALAGLGPVED